MAIDSYTSEDAVRTKLIELIKLTYPDLQIVKAYQNLTQPVDILNGEELLTIDVERVNKLGTDFVCGVDDSGLHIMAGDRTAQVLLELYSPNALGILTSLRDIWETPEYVEEMLNLGMMEERSNLPPTSSTRKQSKEKYVTSARYISKFNIGIFYSAQGVILGDIETANITRSFG
jgi:hypothetical protein